MDIGALARVKPFNVEVHNVKCLRCGNYGHQSGDRDCPLKDVIMPSEKSRLKQDNHLNAMLAHTNPNEVCCLSYQTFLYGLLTFNLDIMFATSHNHKNYHLFYIFLYFLHLI